MNDLIANAAVIWLIVAAALGVAEVLAPGVFLAFFAIAAAITGLVTLALPDLTPTLQLASFTVWSAVSVAIGRRWYRDYPVAADDPLLNDRSARLLGEMVTVVVPITGGQGRVRVGDSEWSATGDDAPAGARVRIVGVRDTILVVEAPVVESLPPPA